MSYEVVFTPMANRHRKALTAREQAIVVDTVSQQLVHQPGVNTRNRKELRPNPLAPRELRIGNIRVYYDYVDEPEKVVTIVAIGVKVGNRVFIGGEEFDDENAGSG